MGCGGVSWVWVGGNCCLVLIIRFLSLALGLDRIQVGGLGYLRLRLVSLMLCCHDFLILSLRYLERGCRGSI